MKNVSVQPLAHHALVGYLSKRGITFDVGMTYCREVHYEIHGKNYFAIGFPNNSDGYELRNPYFKGCMGRKDITILHGKEVPKLDTSCCHVFEGFFDFLSDASSQRYAAAELWYNMLYNPQLCQQP